MDHLNKQKADLVEKLGVHLEKKDHLAPVAARILSYVILTGKLGTTFEDLVNDLCASKSTISTHLSHLQDLKKISYFTKTGDRKKYYIINRDTMLQGISNMVEEWKNEKELHLEIKAYKEETNKTLEEENKFELGFHDSFIGFLDGAISSIIKLKETVINNKH
ncbi:MAG: transcriptional regulator [Xanthomarina sp.]|uniref:Transcriptional regulator n=1 Tax=Xanthomarina gelatinilytica TaxID=1137281 RepID=A0A3D6BNS1_9FLAO|nr:transcriptional regulator [Xanthomarina sp.]MAL22358.1 transcriptional regulator [Xanthomarina sp.]MBF60971.1 transcriptional regulator [Xanthomarina sp.]HAI19101.1 transcriptional regulator [Xanthomarina gelatinilytica]HCY80514.1 transcriptional regulator [Xanthomarina gelatinilytica]|tara:strand:+ start:429 stop:917 length:489 start_codon:yes stop_codon:yes gene_type:complete